MYKTFINKINAYQNITIFRHARPDGDCIFSSLALYYFLKDNFKDKKVKLAGFDEYDVISKIEKVSDDFINSSLAIALDTATIARVDDKRIINAEYIIKIDHHPSVEEYGNLDYTDPICSATCELLARMLLSKEFSKYKLSDKVITYLYCGIVTDTLNFKTANTTANTLSIASKLVEKGNLKPSDLVELVFNINLDTFEKVTKIRSFLKVEDKFGYILMNQKDLKKLNISGNDAKNNIDEIGKIKELNVWAFAVENAKDKYDVSVRSKRKYVINEIVKQYNGGGHINAAATRGISLQELNSMFKKLSKIAKK